MSRLLTILGSLSLAAAALPAAASAADSVPAKQDPAARAPGAAPDRARPVTYRGKTHAGDPISFKLAGSRVTGLSAYVPTVCLATDGLPLSGTDPFDPPGSFRIGRT